MGPTPEGVYSTVSSKQYVRESGLGSRESWARASWQEREGAAHRVAESPGAEELRGSLWATSPGGVGGAAGPRKRRGSGLADEGLAKKRTEGT